MRVRCVGAIVHDAGGRLLVIRRGRPPGAGRWSLPGGRVEPGESDAEAVVRELLEETGLRVETGSLIGRVERPGPGGWNRIHLIVDDIAAEVERLTGRGARFRNDIVEGPGGKQVLVVDPSGNLVELFEPAG